MGDIIMTLFRMSLQGGIAILVVFAIRYIFDKLNMPKKYISILWFIPFICLVLPWRVESDYSVWQLFDSENVSITQEFSNNVYTEYTDYINQSGNIVDLDEHISIIPEASRDSEAVLNGNINSSNISTVVDNNVNADKNRGINLYDIVALIWISGAIIIVGYSICVFISLMQKIKVSINVKDNVYYAQNINVPFVVGIVKPKIYIPIGVDENSMSWIIAHERMHIRRKDTLKKIIIYGITCLHWFNPLVWMAFWFFGKDMEMACDEETVKSLGEEYRQDYATVLLSMASKKNDSGLSMFPAFGGGEVKERICNVLKSKNTMKIASVAVVTLIVVMVVLFFTDGPNAKEQDIQLVKDNDPDSETVLSEDINTTDNESYENETTCNVDNEDETIGINKGEPLEQEKFTTETFLKLCAEGGFYDEFKYQGIKENLKYSNFIEERSDDNTYLWYYRCPFVYKDKSFEFKVYYTVGEGIEPDNLLKEFQILSIERGESYKFLNTKDFSALFDLMENGNRPEHYMNVSLPKELDEGNWEAVSYSSSGFVYDKNYKEVDKSETCDASHYAPAGIGWLDANGHAEFDANGNLLYVSYRNNYSYAGEKEEYIDGCQMQAILSTFYAELFIPEYGENGKVNTYDKFIAENGREPQKTTMEYWYVFIGEPDSEYCYFVYLNKDYFTKEDAIEMARSVKIVEW